MGRPAVYKRGAMTAAERQRRHRKKLAAEQREAERIAFRIRQHERRNDLATQYKQATREFLSSIWQDARHSLWVEMFQRKPLFDPEGEADKLATQIAEWLAMSDDITIDDVRGD